MGEGTVGLRFERDEELGEGERKRGVGCARERESQRKRGLWLFYVWAPVGPTLMSGVGPKWV